MGFGRRGLSGLSGRAAQRAAGGRGPLGALTALVGVVLVIGLVGEGAGHMAHPVVPQPAKAEVGLPGPLLDMPSDGPADRVWQYYSTNGFYKIPIGNSTFDIPAVDDLRGGINRFPDKASVEKLRYYGIHTIVLHLTMPKATGHRRLRPCRAVPTPPQRRPGRWRGWASPVAASARSSSMRSAPGRRPCTGPTDDHVRILSRLPGPGVSWDAPGARDAPPGAVAP